MQLLRGKGEKWPSHCGDFCGYWYGISAEPWGEAGRADCILPLSFRGRGIARIHRGHTGSWR